MVEKLERLIFFLLILFLPIQLGRHFWPSFSYVSGIRVDYLSPTLYVTDILILLLFLFFLLNIRKHIAGIQANNLFFVFTLVLFTSNLLALSLPAAFFGFLKFFEFFFFAWYTATYFKKNEIGLFIDTLSISTLVVSLLVIWQFLQQGSVGGVFYFLGERTFTTSTIGIATMNLWGQTVLRPYATFPHPNVLAFFLFLIIVFVIHRIMIEKDTAEKVFLFVTLISSNIALFLTFSRAILLFYIGFLIYFFAMLLYKKSKKILLVAIPIVFILAVYVTSYFPRFFNKELLARDLFLRTDLIAISFKIFQQYPFFGVGLNNFFYYEAPYQKVLTPTLLQPVHNIYLLVLVEVGIIAFAIFVWFLGKSFLQLVGKIKSVKEVETREFNKSVFIVFLAALLVGFFDHFFLTVEQGELMFALILGLAWTKLR